MAGCSGGCSGGFCSGPGSCGPTCACPPKDPGDYKIGEDIPCLPYESLYVRCQCRFVGFTPETWQVIGTSILTKGGKHYPLGTKAEWKCEPYTALVGEDRFISDKLWNLEKKQP